MKNKKMPIGIDDFKEIITQDFYYVDKTGMIKELLDNWGKVNLFTRPRRFGKSINMSMLQRFFEAGTDESLFDGLTISKDTKLCEEYLGKFPVIAISLKQVSGKTFERAEANIWDIIKTEAGRFSFLLNSDRIDEEDKNELRNIRGGKGIIDSSLYHLSRLLQKHFGKKTIILIDEYDAPLQKAYENGYYDDMVRLIRQIFGYALKSNESLFFSVLTGCMRVSKESIFSDLNNPTMYTLVDEMCDEWFGFTDQEVKKLLADLRLEEYYGLTKDWYDGYRIGSTDIYCPWDVINWCRQLLLSSDREPRNYWVNVSENNIVYRFVEMADDATRHDLEVLSGGATVDKELSFELTYKDIYSSIDNLWSVLFTTGYLTVRGRNADGTYRLAIPNREILRVFGEQVKRWLLTQIEGGLQELYRAFDVGKAEEIEKYINICLKESISFMDGGNTEEQKEASYHTLLVGMAKGRRNWIVKSNREAGKGRADIILIDRQKNEGIIIEVKHTDDVKSLNAKAEEACHQIRERNYREYFPDFRIDRVKEYGIAFCGKECRVLANLA
ncbi:MAG: ATP-binding protein [Lachnospiraceae bacterium]|nr:ATP-binding protein [Lachnospiraceae bacterium]